MRFDALLVAICIVTLMTSEPYAEDDHAHLKLPEDHLESIRILEMAYLAHDDPIRQSGFSGGPDRWRAERSSLLDAIDRDGDLLDLGCANGYLLESLVAWGTERGIRLNPYGVDLNALLIQEAIRRIPELAHHFWVANVWGWLPPKRFRWVYAIWDLVPTSMTTALAQHLLEHAVTKDGALIFGAYGSKSDDKPPFDIARVLRGDGLPISGESTGGELPSGGPVTRFAWIKRRDWLSNL